MSSPSVSQVRAWSANAHTLADAASAVDAKVDEFDGIMNAMTRAVDHVMLDWKGEVARASEASTLAEKQISNRLGMGILQISDVLNAHGPDLQHASTAAVRAVDDFTHAGYTVADNGCVSPPPSPVGGFPADVPVGATPAEAATIASANAAQHQSAVQAALQAAGAADAAIAHGVSAAAEALDAAADRATTAHAVSPEVQSILDGHSQLPTDPNQLRSFWNSLSANDKAELWNHDRNVGNMDGVAVADRDHMNRRHLVEMRRDAEAKATAQLRELGPEPPFHRSPRQQSKDDDPAWVRWNERRQDIVRPVDQLAGLDEKVNGGDEEHVRFLMTIRDNGQAAVAVNNPDTADNVSTYVPGTGTNLGSIGGDVNRADKMVDAARRVDPTAMTSVITWQDYKAPQNPFLNSPSMSYANAAAGTLDHFQNGIAATHIGDTPANTSVLGHSYGTTVVGVAASGDHVLNADDVIMVASPGFGGANSVEDMNLTGIPADQMHGRVWSTYSVADPMNYVTPDPWLNPLKILPDPFGIDHMDGTLLGPRPINPHSMSGTFVGAESFESAPWGGHSDYWNRGNPALNNMGAIIAGKDDQVTR